MGDVLSFAGGEILHGGDPLIHGIRYILAVFLFLEKGNDNEDYNEGNSENEKRGLKVGNYYENENQDGSGINSNELENVGKGIRIVKEVDKEMKISMNREEDKVKKRLESIHEYEYNQTGEKRFREMDFKEKEGEEEEEEMSNIFMKSFLSCYKTDPNFILNPIKNKDLESKTKIIIDNNLNSKNSVYHSETSKSAFSFEFDLIE